MHTAICAFDDRARAEQAMDSLVRSGIARDDIHIEHKHARAAREDAPNDRWDGMEREVAVDRSVLESFGNFFVSLFGRDHPSGHHDTYAQHVERGSYVVVVDTNDEAEADRARTMLQDLQAGDLNVVHRPEQRPLRDIVGQRPRDPGMVERGGDSYEAASAQTAMERERAMAAGRVAPTTGPDLRDPDLGTPPGLRYSDKDKPNG